jgi:ATP-dependent Clp protease ATP-binding subunit ClpC
VFERFTPPARQVVVYAQEESQRLGHDHIGGEHILLGLLSGGEGIPARVLGSLGITLEEAQKHVGPVHDGPEAPATGMTPFTPAAKEALERASDEADALNHAIVGTEHVLLGLIAVRDESVELILSDLNVQAEQIRPKVLRMMSGSA